MKFLKAWLLFFTGAIALRTRKTPATADTVKDAAILYTADFDGAGTAAIHARTEDGKVIKLGQGAALTAQLTSITHTAPGTPDYAIQNLTTSTPYGFVSADEGNTVLSVIANLQARLAQVEARLEANGLVAAN